MQKYKTLSDQQLSLPIVNIKLIAALANTAIYFPAYHRLMQFQLAKRVYLNLCI